MSKASKVDRHDLKEALQTLDLCVKDLERGYRFDDKHAKPKIEVLARSAKIIRSAINATILADEAET